MKNFINNLRLQSELLGKEILQHNLLLFILIVAFVLRFWGTTYGFPFLYPPDEGALVKEVLVLPFRHFNPGHFDWPHLHFYLTFIVFAPIYLAQWLLGKAPTSLNDSLLIYYFAGRLLSVFMGTATVFLVYKLGRKLFNPQVGLISAYILAFNLVHLQESQLATVDVPMLFWLTLSFYFIANLKNNNSVKAYATAGFLVGIATSTKYNAVFAVVSIVSLYLFQFIKLQVPQNFKEIPRVIKNMRATVINLKLLIASFLAMIFGFILFTPFALIDIKTFLIKTSPQGALWQFFHVTQDNTKIGILERYTSVFTHSFMPGFTGIVLVAALIGLLILFKKYRVLSAMIIPFLLGYFFIVGRLTLTPSHYFLPLFPFVSIISALGIVEIVPKMKNFLLISEKRSWQIILIVFLFLLTLQAVRFDLSLLRPDTRTQAYNWMVENIPAGSGVVTGDDYGPDLSQSPFVTYSIYDLLLNEDLSRPVYPKLNDKGIFFGVLGDYDLGEKYLKASWDPNNPVYPDYLLDKAKVVARFDPQFRTGPTIMIFEIDYDYEIKNKHKNDE